MIKEYEKFPILLDVIFKQYLNVHIAIVIGLVLETLKFEAWILEQVNFGLTNDLFCCTLFTQSVLSSKH